MGIKIIKLFLFLIIFHIIFVFSDVQAAMNTEVVRVGLTDNNFQNVLKQQVIVFGTADCEIYDLKTGKILLRVPANKEIMITNLLSGMEVLANGSGATLQNFVILCPTGLLGVKGLKRKGMQALYHGAFEINQEANKSGFYLINLIEVQDYLKVLCRMKCR
ncbi:hypothetical protein IJO12_01255 [bacterium]|nr:hypothetical protein [bacterium]